MYFSAFPKITYSLDDGKTIQIVTDITKRVGFLSEFVKNYSYYDLYDIKDGETPEIVSDLFYNSTFYHWIILHANEIVDPRFDWPLSQENLISYCKQKYGGETEIYKTKLYTNAANYTVNSYRALEETSASDEIFLTFEDGTNFLLKDPPATLYPVSRLEYETAVNESKRKIKVPKSEIISAIQTNFGGLIAR